MRNELTIILTETAVETYDSIFDQIKERWGESVAIKFEQKVFRTLDLISKSPLVFKAIDIESNVRKGLINKNCSFFYQVSSSEVQILYFWDNRQEPLE